MKTILYLLAFTLFFTFNLSAQETTWKIHTTEAYEIKYPSNWDFKPSAGMMEFLALCPLESDDDNLRENINLVKEDAGDLSLEDYFASSINMLEKTFQELEVISTKDVSKDGVSMKKFTYTAKMGPEHLYFSQVYGIIDNTAFILTFTSEKEKFTDFQGIETIIFDSFKLLIK